MSVGSQHACGRTRLTVLMFLEIAILTNASPEWIAVIIFLALTAAFPTVA